MQLAVTVQRYLIQNAHSFFPLTLHKFIHRTHSHNKNCTSLALLAHHLNSSNTFLLCLSLMSQSQPNPSSLQGSHFFDGYPCSFYPLTAFLATPLRLLNSATDAALMSSVSRDGTRLTDKRRMSSVLPMQTYVIRNNQTIYDRGENTIYAPPAEAYASGDFFEKCIPIYKVKQTRDGSILGYLITDIASDRPLLKVHFHGDTTNPLSRTLKAFIRSPVLKWDVENYGLYQDLVAGTNLGHIQEVYPDSRVFFPADIIGMPRLEMQVAASLGLRYYMAVTNIPEPMGEVDSSAIGRFAPRSETYRLSLRNCTREEAVLWLAMVIATDMKRRKSQNTQYGRTFLPLYA